MRIKNKYEYITTFHNKPKKADILLDDINIKTVDEF